MHEVEISPSAFKFLTSLKRTHKPIADRIVSVIDEFKTNPFLGKKLTGNLSDYRSVRIGEYRILYSVFEKRLLIHVVKIAHRREVYR